MKRLEDAQSVHVRIPKYHIDALDKMSAKRGGASIASLIREAVKKFIDKKGL